MDAKATAHLHQLARPASRPHSVAHEHVSAAIAELIDQFPMPAVVVSWYQDVLAANPLARALCPGFEVGQNLSRWRFLDPAAEQMYPDWDEATALAVRVCGKAPPIIPTILDCAHSSANCPVPVSDSSSSGNRPTWDTPRGSATCAIQMSAIYT